MKRCIWALAVIISALLPYVTKAEGAIGPADYIMCRSQKTVRTIRVVSASDGCHTVYTKFGVDKIVGSAKSLNSCVQIMKNIRGNLEGASWKCKQVGAATFTDSN